MNIEKLAVSDLLEDPANARTHDAKNLRAIKGSLKRFGQQKPIVVDPRGIVVAGNGTLAAARELGWSEIDVVRTSLAGAEAIAYAIADNRAGELAGWDDDVLSKALAALDADGWDLPDIGFDDDDWMKPKAEVTEGLTDEDAVPDEAPARTQRGEVWQLGAHRVMCGDSTSAGDVARLMAGATADMVFTDPPYGMFLDTDYDSMFAADSSHRKTGQRFDKVAGDHDFNPNFINAIFAAFQGAREAFLWGADYYSELIPDRKAGSWVVWDKRCTEEMDRVSGNTFELCWSKAKHKRLIARLQWSGHHGMQRDDTKTRVHPTQKPVALAEWFFEHWGKPTDLVTDLFLGSGSTLIACEKTARRCYGMEIDPHYCDVIIERWEKFTGKKARLDGI